MKLYNLDDLYVDELKDLYSAETQLIKALPKMAKAATSPDLKSAFEGHLEETREHARRIETIFENLKEKPKGRKCVGMEGLIAEGQEMAEQGAADAVRDAGLIGAAQRVEHYEMAGYGTARAFARQLGYLQDAELLQQTLDEEADTDQKLSQIAESFINWRAEDKSGNGSARTNGGA